MEYRQLEPIERQEAERNLATGDTSLICETLLRIAFFEPDAIWAEGQCFELLGHSSSEVRQVAATCLGHLARIHRSPALVRAQPMLEELLKDPEVAGAAQAALDDIEMFAVRTRSS